MGKIISDDSLRRALSAIAPRRPETVDALRPLYDGDVEFRDPIQHLRGLNAFMAMNHRLVGRTRELSFAVKSAVGEGDNVFLAWTMNAAPKIGPRIAVDGATHATTHNRQAP